MNYTYSHKIETRFNDFDNQNVLNNAMIPTYFETTHLHYFISVLHLGWGYNRVPLFVDEISMKYIRCITPDINVYVHFNLVRVGIASITLEFFVTDGLNGELCNKGMLKLAHVNPDTRKAVPIPDSIRQVLLSNIINQEHATM